MVIKVGKVVFVACLAHNALFLIITIIITTTIIPNLFSHPIPLLWSLVNFTDGIVSKSPEKWSLCNQMCLLLFDGVDNNQDLSL